jgi:phage/plasmid primase-like uncharacterized protein
MIDAKKLTQTLGGKWYGRYGCSPCPVCQCEGRKTQNALTLADGIGGKLLLNCKKTGCDYRDIATAAGISHGSYSPPDPETIAKRAAEQREADAKRSKQAQRVWMRAQPIAGTIAESYLRGRGITCPLPDTLRWLPETYHGPSSSYCAAMIADVAVTGGIHRTFFTKKGQRLDKSAKMMLGPCSGGAVRLSGAAGPLVVCEGIETGLSLLSGLLIGPHAVWAALSTSGIKGLTLPHKPGDLMIATDSDDSGAGRDAGDTLARTAHALGWNVSLMPAPAGMDWNDALQRGVTV